MKKLIVILVIFFAAQPLYAEKIKIKSAYKVDVAKESVVNLNKNAMLKNNVFVVPRGRRIRSRLNDNITYTSSSSSYSTKTGDIITTQLMQDWYYLDKLVAPEGSLVKGKITGISLQNSVRISFDTIIRPDNYEIRIVSKPIRITPDNFLSRIINIPLGTEFTIQITNDVITKPY